MTRTSSNGSQPVYRQVKMERRENKLPSLEKPRLEADMHELVQEHMYTAEKMCLQEGYYWFLWQAVWHAICCLSKLVNSSFDSCVALLADLSLPPPGLPLEMEHSFPVFCSNSFLLPVISSPPSPLLFLHAPWDNGIMEISWWIGTGHVLPTS